MRPSWIRVNPKSNDRYPTKRKEKEKTHWEDEVKTEAESRVVSLQAKESHRLPAATRSQEKARNEFSPRTNLDSIPWLQTSGLQTVKEKISVVSNHAVHETLFWPSQETTTHCNWWPGWGMAYNASLGVRITWIWIWVMPLSFSICTTSDKWFLNVPFCATRLVNTIYFMMLSEWNEMQWQNTWHTESTG